MKRRLLVLLIVIGAGVLSVGTSSAADKITLTGVVSDELCASKHMMNHGPADCTQQCVLRGADYVLVAKDKVYTLKADNSEALEALEKYSGETVTISAEPDKDFIWVLSVMRAK